MSRPLRSPVCCIAGCSRPATQDSGLEEEALCAAHSAAASPYLRARFASTMRRRTQIENLWSDAARYEAVVESGRYLKLCDVTQAVLEQTDSAWIRMKLDIILDEAKGGARGRDALAGSGLAARAG
ncbi:MAG TPA: hypothetical protein VMU56_03725 [Beijerinckiaceae bacterium]|nr:hypothetical protein [Beijerinckiaceae bacterium]